MTEVQQVSSQPIVRKVAQLLVLVMAVSALSVAALSAPAPVAAKDGDVIRRGACTNRSVWKLKLSPENGQIEIEFEVDTPKIGQTWSVRLRHNGVRFFKADRVTKAPSGSFKVRRVRPNRSGPDYFVAKAINLKTGEVCRGTATF